MKKIVHIMLAGAVTDGFSYQDNLITKYQRKAGYEVTIITSQWVYDNAGNMVKSAKSNYINEDDIKVIRLGLKGRDDFNRKLRSFKNLIGSIDSEQPDILFIHNMNFIGFGDICKYLNKNKSVKVYVDNHSDKYNSGRNYISRTILHGVLWKSNAQRINKYCMKFYGVTPARVEWLIQQYKLPKNKCELLVFGADDELIDKAKTQNARSRLRKELNVSDDNVVIVTGGKIDNNKRETILLMKAFRNYDNPSIRLVVFGSVIKELKNQFDELLSDERIVYVGWKNAYEIYEIFMLGDIIAFPGLHSVLWEQAVGCGKACVFRRLEGFTHVDLNGNCMFFEDTEIDTIRRVLSELIETDGWKVMQEVSQRVGMKYFSYKDISIRSIQCGGERNDTL